MDTMDPLEKRIEGILAEITKLVDESKIESHQSEGNAEKDMDGERGRSDTFEKLLQSVSQQLAQEDKTGTNFAEGLLPLILHIRRNCLPSFSPLTSRSSDLYSVSSSSPTNWSLLTIDNVNANSGWESISFLAEKRVTVQMVANPLKTLLEKETFRQHLLFLRQLKGSRGLHLLWDIFGEIRVSRIDANLEGSPNILQLIEESLSFDTSLVKDGFFSPLSVSFGDVLEPYDTLFKESFRATLESYDRAELDPDTVREMALLMSNFRDLVDDFEKSFGHSSEASSSGTWLFLEEQLTKRGLINYLLKYLNEQMLTFFSVGPNFDEIQSKDNVLEPIGTVFDLLDKYHSIDLEKFTSSFSVLVEVNLIDFIQKQNDHRKSSSSSRTEHVYLILNTLYFIEKKLEGYGIKISKFNQTVVEIEQEIEAEHSSVLSVNRNGSIYWVLYLKKLWITFEKSLTFGGKRKFALFKSVFCESLQHFTRSDLSCEDTLIVLLNVPEFLILFMNSSFECLHEDADIVHSCCWLLLARLAVKAAPLSLLVAGLSETDSTTFCGAHWLDFVQPSLLSKTYPLNLRICLARRSQPLTSTVIRTFLENKNSLSIKVLANLELIEEEDHPNGVLLCSALFKLYLLQESEPLSLALFVLSLLNKHDSWREFSVSYLTEERKVCWFQALESLFDDSVQTFLLHILPQFLYQMITFDSLDVNLTDLYNLAGIPIHDLYYVVSECVDAILSIVGDIIMITPTVLLSSLDYIGNHKEVDTKSLLFNSLPAHMILSCCVKQLRNPGNYGLDSILQFTTPVADKLLAVYPLAANGEQHKYQSLAQNISAVVTSRQSKANYVSTTEEERIQLISALLEANHRDTHIVQFLSRFLASNSHWSESLTELNPIKFIPHEKSTKFQPLREYRQLKSCETVKIMENMNWVRLLNEVRSRISVTSIGYLLSDREDVVDSLEEEVVGLKIKYDLQ